MGDGPEHMEDQFASGRRRVDLLLKAQQRHALGAQLLDRSEKLGERASEPIEAHHGQRVALAGVGEKFDEAGTIHALAGHDVGEHLNGTGFLETYGLPRHILIAGAYTGIAQNIAHAGVSQTVVLWTL